MCRSRADALTSTAGSGTDSLAGVGVGAQAQCFPATICDELHVSCILCCVSCILCCAPQKRQAERAKQRSWQNDRVRYGKTDGGKYVDQHSLEQLVSLGYELPLAAEALRQVGCGRCMEVSRLCFAKCMCTDVCIDKQLLLSVLLTKVWVEAAVAASLQGGCAVPASRGHTMVRSVLLRCACFRLRMTQMRRWMR